MPSSMLFQLPVGALHFCLDFKIIRDVLHKTFFNPGTPNVLSTYRPINKKTENNTSYDFPVFLVISVHVSGVDNNFIVLPF